MREFTDQELEDNALGLQHRELGLFDTMVNDITVDHPDTKAHYDGRKGIDYTELENDEDTDSDDEE
jgi:hypothetical protein